MIHAHDLDKISELRYDRTNPANSFMSKCHYLRRYHGKGEKLDSCVHCDRFVVAAGLDGCGRGRANNRSNLAFERTVRPCRPCWGLLGKETACAIINEEGGINGKKLRYVVEDGQYKFDVAMAAYHKIMANENPIIISAESTAQAQRNCS